MTEPIEFVNELPRRAGGVPEASWRAELRKRPGEWAKIKTLTNRTNTGGYGAVPGFEIATRTIDGQRWMFARYIGNGAA